MHLGQHAVLTLPVQRELFAVGEKTIRFEPEGTAERGDEGDIRSAGGDATTPRRFLRPIMGRVPPFPSVRQSSDIVFGRGSGADDG